MLVPRNSLGDAFTLRAEVRHIRPAIGRRLRVPAQHLLADLHDVRQTVFGWSGSRLHAFQIGKRSAPALPDRPDPLLVACRRVRTRSRTIALTLAVTALLATSCADPEKRSVYRFEKSSEGPLVTLTANEPRARYLARAVVLALGPDRANTTDTALATVQGLISSSETAATAAQRPFVRVAFGAEGQARDAATVQTGFQLARPLRFAGNCSAPGEGTPCDAEIELDFALDQPSALSESERVSVAWSVDFESRTFKAEGGGGDEPVEAPWTVEVSEAGEP